MAKLYFYYSAMNAGKSTILLQSSYNYQERGMSTLLFTPIIDNRKANNKEEVAVIHSRIGLSAEAICFDSEFNLFEYTKAEQLKLNNLRCVLVDEAQFLKKHQVLQLANVADKLNLPVLTYGIRSDFRGEPFEGSKYLLVWADNLTEVKTICSCGKKATMNMRIDETGRTVTNGEQIEIGGNEKYIAMCRKHFNEAFYHAIPEETLV